MMMIQRRLRIRALMQGEDGFALLMVMGIGIVLMLLVVTALSLSTGSLKKAMSDQNWAAAESAAYAGVEDYQSKLSNNNTYYLYGNPASNFSPTGTVSLPPTSNPAFGIGTGSGPNNTWATVPGGDATATYRYEVDNSQYVSTGVIRLRSTGRVGTRMRSIVVNVKQHGFVDFVYYTDYELRDPIQSSLSCVPTHDWQTPHSNSCTEIQFGSSDVLNGPVHSNDTMLVCGSQFLGGFSSSDPVAPYYQPVGGSCPAAQFGLGSENQPKTRALINMPATNGQMRQEVRTDLATVPNPGCLYTGPTSIVFNADGTMTVISPFTKATNLKADANGALTIGSAGSICGSIAALQSVGGATISAIQSNLIFVQDVPSASSDPNGWATNSYPPSFTCNNSSTVAGWKFGGLAYPVTNEDVPSATPAHYGCRKGDVYVRGKMQGKLTIAVDDYIYVTGDITYINASPGGDMLGLVGNNAVWVWNPMNNGSPIYPAAGRVIDAVILSINHTFQVQNYDMGNARGTLTLYGAIAQKFRGPVGLTSGSGYLKDYKYDPRLQFQAPAKFLSPVAATYGVSQQTEVSSPFKLDGSYAP